MKLSRFNVVVLDYEDTLKFSLYNHYVVVS